MRMRPLVLCNMEGRLCANHCTEHLTQTRSSNFHNKPLYKQYYCVQFPMREAGLREITHLSQSHRATM